MDLSVILTLLAAIVTVVGFVYGFLQNVKVEIKEDINNHKIENIDNHVCRLETRIDKLEKRFDS